MPQQISLTNCSPALDIDQARGVLSGVPVYLHFSLQAFPVGDLLIGMKSTRKSLQRVGQRYTDEVFEDIRKREFSAPSLFASLWVTNREDVTIFRKAWEETGFTTGYLYEVLPVAPPYEVEPYWEVLACKAVTQSKLRRGLLPFVEDMARKFWRPQIVDGGIRDYLCPQGAIIARLIREVKSPEFNAI